MPSEWTPLSPSEPSSFVPRTESNPQPMMSIKRSSWNAGMAAEFAQLPPPNSPAAWHHSRQHQSRMLSVPLTTEVSDSASLPFPASQTPVSPHTPRSRSPTRRHQHLQVPQLDSIRSVSSGVDLETTESPIADENRLSSAQNPFNFTSTYITPNPPRSSGHFGASQRRGHHYKHSSVSLNFFQEPEARAPLALPVSLAIPTFGEYWQSITPHQLRSLGWCVLKLLVTLGCYLVSSPVHSMALLAHLLAYETVVSSTVSLITVLANFEVWSRSSLRLPFALKRVEVLLAFGLAVVLLFIGSDVISHIVQDLATHGHGHSHNGHSHSHQPPSPPRSVDQRPLATGHTVMVLLALLTTVPTMIRNKFGNTLNLSTVMFALIVLVIPCLPEHLATFVDAGLQPAMVMTMLYLGYSSSKLFGGMLAMSYGGTDHSRSISALISSDPCVVQVDDISLWQVHHDLWLATMKITMSGSVKDEKRVREMAARAVREAVDVTDVEWETTIEIHRAEVGFY